MQTLTARSYLIVIAGLLVLNGCLEEYQTISLEASITGVQPMTGIVLWTDSDYNDTDAIQLEYSYIGYNEIVSQKGQFDWSAVDTLLDRVAQRGHQAVLRFYFVYPGQQTTVPQYIKDSAGYTETLGISEGLDTWFPDWSSSELQDFTLDFYTQLSLQYDQDIRLGFLQVGFGLWAEYHIYDGPMRLDDTFPSKDFQAEFLQHMNDSFDELTWNISIDAADTQISPFDLYPDLLELVFGLFDDSFLNETHDEYNADSFNFFNYINRYEQSPMGGELNYYTEQDQINALEINGPHGISFEQMAQQYQISYMIGNDQPLYQPMSRIKEAGMAIGYKFKILSFEASATASNITVENTGIAPLYYDAFVTVNGVRSTQSLKGLLPEQSELFTVDSGGIDPQLTIESDRLVQGQVIEYEASISEDQ